MDRALEFAVKTCAECQENQRSPARALMHPWEWPDRQWAIIHLDYTGPVKGKMILVFVESPLKWIEAHAVNSATSQATIEKFRLVFSTHGLPDVLVSDNGTPLTSEEFAAFVRSNSIKHLTRAHYHPASNGLTERAIQTLKKNALRKDPVETVLKLRSHVSSFVTASLLTPLLAYHQLNFSWARDPDLVSTSGTKTSPKESRKDSWIKCPMLFLIMKSSQRITVFIVRIGNLVGVVFLLQ